MSSRDINLFKIRLRKNNRKKDSSNSISKFTINKILPPITKKVKKEIEEEPSSVITKLFNDISYEFKNKTNENIKISQIYKRTNKTYNTIENKNTLENSEIKTTFLTTSKYNKTITENKNTLENSQIKNTFLTTSKNNKTITENKKINLVKSTKIIYPISINEKITTKQNFYLSKFYRRIRKYQPHIDENWKNKIGLNNERTKKFLIYTSNKKDIDSQVNIIYDEVKILESNISFFKLNIFSNKNFKESFKSLSLKAQIKINKCLEELIGILILLPQLLLNDFYHYVEKLKNINIIDNEKLKEKYIFDELECFYYNNNLLNESLDFFKNCFESFITLSNEVNDMHIKSKKFENIITIIEKARYNINNIISSCENALRNYEKDITFINKILKYKDKKKIENNPIKLVNKNINNQFSFKLNSERQQNLRIIYALKKDKDDKQLNNTNSFKSIIHSKLIDKLLHYSPLDIKKKIYSRRIMDEMKKYKEKKEENEFNKIIKINY